jgi:hypothetical protein
VVKDFPHAPEDSRHGLLAAPPLALPSEGGSKINNEATTRKYGAPPSKVVACTK